VARSFRRHSRPVRRPPCCRRVFFVPVPVAVGRGGTNRCAPACHHKSHVARIGGREQLSQVAEIWFTSSLTGSDTRAQIKGVKRRQQGPARSQRSQNQPRWRASDPKRRGLMPSPRPVEVGERSYDSQPPQHGCGRSWRHTRPPASPEENRQRPHKISAPLAAPSAPRRQVNN